MLTEFIYGQISNVYCLFPYDGKLNSHIIMNAWSSSNNKHGLVDVFVFMDANHTNHQFQQIFQHFFSGIDTIASSTVRFFGLLGWIGHAKYLVWFQ